MGLSTRASRLLHKCGENDTICVIAAMVVLLWLLFSINDSVTSCAVWRKPQPNCDLCLVIKSNVWWKRTFPPMVTTLVKS